MKDKALKVTSIISVIIFTILFISNIALVNRSMNVIILFLFTFGLLIMSLVSLSNVDFWGSRYSIVVIGISIAILYYRLAGPVVNIILVILSMSAIVNNIIALVIIAINKRGKNDE